MHLLLGKARQTIVLWKKSTLSDCILLMGLPGAGKSHVSRYLHEQHGYTVLSGENITHALFGDTQCTSDQYKQAYITLYELARALLEDGYSIIIDGTNLQYGHRKQAYDAVWPDTKTLCIYLIADDNTATKRIKKRGVNEIDSTNILSNCSDETFQKFKESIEYAQDGEVIHQIISDENIFESVEQILILNT